MQVDLCAAIEMIDKDNCIVRNIRRNDIDESPLLPTISFRKTGGKWVHSTTGKESDIGTAIGEAIDKHLKELSKSLKDDNQ